MRFYRWNYSWKQLKELYIQKNKELAERTNAFCEFLVTLTTAALGGKSESEGEVGIDTGEGLDEMSDEQIQHLKDVLGEKDFYVQYPQFKDEF